MPRPRDSASESQGALARASPLLLMLIALLLISIAASSSAQGTSDDLELVDVGYRALDSDEDGLVDTAEANATVHNGNGTRARVFVLKVALVKASEEVGARTASELLDPDMTVNLSLRVSNRADTTPGDYRVVVTLYSESLVGDVMGEDETTLYVYPLGAYELGLTANRTSAQGLENGTVGFALTVHSLSNNPTGVRLNATGQLGWGFELEPTDLEVAPGASADVSLRVWVPHNEAPGTRETLEVEAVATRNETAFGTISISVTVQAQVFELALELLTDEVYLASGGSETIEGLVQNRGNNQDNITFLLDAPEGWGVSFDPPFLLLDRGTSGLVMMTLTAPHGLTEAGVLNINVTARSKGLVADATGSVRVIYNTAELLIDEEALEVDPESPRAGEEVTIQVTVRNLGAITASDVEVLLLSDDQPVANATIRAIVMEGMGIASLAWVPIAGAHLVRIIVDPRDTVGEVNEGNNAASLTVVVIGPELEVQPGDLGIEPNYPPEGTVATVSVRVRNIKNMSSGPFSVRLSIDDVPVHNFSVEGGVPALSNVTLDYEWTTPSGGGRHTFRAEVDPDGEVREADTSNNVALHVFSVNAVPVPQLDVAKDVIYVGDQVTFDAGASADPDGRVRQYFLDYGDGTDSGWTFTALFNHTYSSPGRYEVQLYVRDDAGGQSGEPASLALRVQREDGGKDDTPGAGALAAVVALALLAPARLRGIRRRGRGTGR